MGLETRRWHLGHSWSVLRRAIMLATFSWLTLSCHAEGRRKRDYRLEEHLLEFHVQVDNELFVHTMWPCEDPEDMALVYCRNEAFRNMPPGYCDLLKSHFRHKYDVVMQREGGLRYDCSRLGDYKKYFHPQMQLAPHEANTVVHAIQSFKAPANVLVWGAGFDSELWCQVNAGGRTVFLEQNPDFAQHIQALVPDCPIVLVNYTTLLPQAADLMDKHEELFLQGLPRDILETKWDVILVDGPTGYNDEQPGRMQSIYTSSLLTHGESVVCVDDVVRVVESVYSLSYLGSLFASSVQLKGADTMCFLNP